MTKRASKKKVVRPGPTLAKTQPALAMEPELGEDRQLSLLHEADSQREARRKTLDEIMRKVPMYAVIVETALRRNLITSTNCKTLEGAYVRAARDMSAVGTGTVKICKWVKVTNPVTGTTKNIIDVDEPVMTYRV